MNTVQDDLTLQVRCENMLLSFSEVVVINLVLRHVDFSWTPVVGQLVFGQSLNHRILDDVVPLNINSAGFVEKHLRLVNTIYGAEV
ncbi:hypothetical protein D3C76_1710950 [compost metagenome]